MITPIQRSSRGWQAMSCRLRQLSGWLTVSVLAAGIAGCGISGTSGTSGTPEGSASPTQTADVGDESAAGGGGNPGIMVTPAGGGGIVVGHPLEGGKAGASAPAAGAVGKKSQEDDIDPAATIGAATPAAAPTPQARVKTLEELEAGDEPPPGAVGALADDKGALGAPGVIRLGKSKDTDGDVDPATSIIGEGEDVDAPPAIPQNHPNAALAGGKGRYEDGDEPFTPGGVGGQPAGEIQIRRGSADEVTETFLSLMAAGQVEKVVPLIASRATGVLGKLRDGTATPEQIDELKQLALVRQQENSRPKGGTHRLITFRADKKMLLVESEQKEENCSVVKLEIRDAPRRRK